MNRRLFVGRLAGLAAAIGAAPAVAAAKSVTDYSGSIPAVPITTENFEKMHRLAGLVPAVPSTDADYAEAVSLFAKKQELPFPEARIDKLADGVPTCAWCQGHGTRQYKVSDREAWYRGPCDACQPLAPQPGIPSHTHTPGPIETAGNRWTDPLTSSEQQLFALVVARGLVKPCPDCAVVEWKYGKGNVIECTRCGWLDKAHRFVDDCRCKDCMAPGGYRTMPKIDELPGMTLAELQAAPAGAYARLLEGRPAIEVTKVEKNAFDINTDGWIHNVHSIALVRVVCGVRARRSPDAYFRPMGADRTMLDNGNLLLQHWHITKCHEWGDAPYKLW